MNNQYKIEEIPIIRQNVFTTVLTDINHSQIAADIKSYGKTIKQESPEYGWVSRGFVQYEDIVVPITPEITKLELSVLSVMETITEKQYSISEMWAVNLVKNQSVIAHSHYSNTHKRPDEYYSIAYYPCAPAGAAELIFSTSWCGHMNSSTAITPETGLLVVFNSFITHMTARHKIEEPRIVLSMNLSPINPTQDPNADWSVYWDRPRIDGAVD